MYHKILKKNHWAMHTLKNSSLQLQRETQVRQRSYEESLRYAHYGEPQECTQW